MLRSRSPSINLLTVAGALVPIRFVRTGLTSWVVGRAGLDGAPADHAAICRFAALTSAIQGTMVGEPVIGSHTSSQLNLASRVQAAVYLAGRSA